MADHWLASIIRESGPSPTEPCLHLFAGPYLRFGNVEREVPDGSQRLLVYVALRRGRVDRRTVAGTLWPVGGEERASGNLRSALWRLKRAGIDVVRGDKRNLWTDPALAVDVDILASWANRLLHGAASAADLAVRCTCADSLELLPGWYDDWVLLERERMRQRLLHALEALSGRLVDAGRTAEGLDVALGVVAAEPLRESGQRVLMAAHIAEGNWAEVWRSFDAYTALLRTELGIEAGDGLFEDLTGRALGRAGRTASGSAAHRRGTVPAGPQPVGARREQRVGAYAHG